MKYKDLKTPLRYPGGKTRAIKFLFDEQQMPTREIKEYREPFLGGGSPAIAFSKANPDTPVWVNDKYYNLYCFWITLQKEGQRLADKLTDVKNELMDTEDPLQSHLGYYKVMREGLATATDPFEIAWMFYIMNRCSFSGLGESTGSFSKLACFDKFKHSMISKLPMYAAIMKNWKITNLDYAEVLEGADQDTFIFADPPYDIKSFIYGNGGDMHDSFCHKRFHDDMTASGGVTMITYNSNDQLKEAYCEWDQLDWDLTYSMNSTAKYVKEQAKRKELLLRNYSYPNAITLDGFFS